MDSQTNGMPLPPSSQSDLAAYVFMNYKALFNEGFLLQRFVRELLDSG